MKTEEDTLAELAHRVKHAAAGQPRSFVVIDGPGASGESTLAAQLAAAIGDAHLVQVDDFYLPSSHRPNAWAEWGGV